MKSEITKIFTYRIFFQHKVDLDMVGYDVQNECFKSC